MQVSQEVRDKLVLVIGNLICRCIEEARKIPYILDQEETVKILVDNPSLFVKLVRDEQLEHTEYSREQLTDRLDALTELGQFGALDAFDMSFSGSMESEADLTPLLKAINQLTRTFVVYAGNTITIFEKEFELFMDKFRRSVRREGMTLKMIELTPEDMTGLEYKAGAYLGSAQFLQAFSFDRMLNCQVINKQVIALPTSGYSFSQNLIGAAIRNPRLFPAMIKFILRATYVSQGSWQDLFEVLVKVVYQQPDPHKHSLFVDLAEHDAIFACNLLREPYADLKRWASTTRRAAIEEVLRVRAQKSASC